jgi:hypothetical protein
MKRRTLRPLRPKRQPEQHHHVYVVLLDPAVGRICTVRVANPDRDPKKPCVYVGMTGLTPEERFANRKTVVLWVVNGFFKAVIYRVWDRDPAHQLQNP